MDSESTSNTQYKSVTVDIPEDRLAEFHAFFARFLAGPRGRGRGGRHGGPHGARHGRGHRHGQRCAERREASGQSEPAVAATEI
jgi:hypothetical protein